MARHPGMLITTAILNKRGVCKGWRLRFRRKFPKARVRITQRLCEDKAQVWPWHEMAAKLLNAAGRAEYVAGRTLIYNIKHDVWYGKENSLSIRARNVAYASLFGHLAQQKKYDPAYTP